MLSLLSPAKTLNFKQSKILNHSFPHFLEDSKKLVQELKKLSYGDISKLMKVSEKIAILNFQRFQDFQTPFTLDNAKQALLTFDGDVYKPIDTDNYSIEDLQFAQKHLATLSGLYGVLRPLDLMQAYRLEMGTHLSGKWGSNLYDFWEDKISLYIKQLLENHKEKLILNLASKEYFDSVKPNLIKALVIDVYFKDKDKKTGKYRVLGLFAKRARGMMADFIIKNRIDELEGLKQFSSAGYKFQKALSNSKSLVFHRD